MAISARLEKHVPTIYRIGRAVARIAKAPIGNAHVLLHSASATGLNALSPDRWQVGPLNVSPEAAGIKDPRIQTKLVNLQVASKYDATTDLEPMENGTAYVSLATKMASLAKVQDPSKYNATADLEHGPISQPTGILGKLRQSWESLKFWSWFILG
jgi:hypothetical protein